MGVDSMFDAVAIIVGSYAVLLMIIVIFFVIVNEIYKLYKALYTSFTQKENKTKEDILVYAFEVTLLIFFLYLLFNFICNLDFQFIPKLLEHIILFIHGAQ